MFAKIWDRHVVAALPGGVDLLAIDRIFLHERTGAAALNSLRAAGRAVADPARVFCVMDHIVDTRPGRDDRHPQVVLQALVVHRTHDHGRRFRRKGLDRFHHVVHFLELERRFARGNVDEYAACV